jgi:hypothetical protein
MRSCLNDEVTLVVACRSLVPCSEHLLILEGEGDAYRRGNRAKLRFKPGTPSEATRMFQAQAGNS